MKPTTHQELRWIVQSQEYGAIVRPQRQMALRVIQGGLVDKNDHPRFRSKPDAPMVCLVVPSKR